MYAKDFIFDSHRLSDYNCMICSFDSNNDSPASGGEIEFNVAKSPNRDKFNFYGSKLNSVFTWNFSICKKICDDNQNDYFDQYEESMLAKWLLKLDGYRYLQFDQDGYEDIFYKVQINNMIPHQISGRTIGYDLTVISNCGYGFSDLITKNTTISSATPLKLMVHNDLDSVIFPYITITGSGNFYVSNDSDISQNISTGKASQFTNVSSVLEMDCENDIITGCNPDNFNWYFLRLVDGENIISTNSTLNIEIKYREIRRVIV